MLKRKKILFISEAVTLAHVGRPIALAQALDPMDYDVHFACAPGYEFCFEKSPLIHHVIESISSEQFLNALAAGKPLYNEATLTSYVEQDLRLLDEVRPDLVVGDFRLSLSISARLAKVPYIAISNAYWSPFAAQDYTVPNIPLTSFFPIPVANTLFQLVRPMAFALHTLPLNRVRRKYGLSPLGYSLQRVYTDADHIAYADIPELFRTHELPANHSYLGPIVWSPPTGKPEWWDAVPKEKAVVYVTLGSSGQGKLLPLVLEALSDLPISVIAATAGKIKLDTIPANAYASSYLPGEEAARRAALVICNGGSPTSHQALVAGVPVIGIASNLDQFLNMTAVERAGAGVLKRADRLNGANLRNTVQSMLNNASYRSAAKRIAQAFAHYSAQQRFMTLLSKILPDSVQGG